MQFKNGYLGAFLVVIAVVMTIAGSYVMSLDMEETTAIKYRDSADLTGLFDAEEAPSYMPFNPSANQTGYYTDRNTKYFDGVNATTTLQPNKYQLNLAPTSTTTEDDYSLGDTTSAGTYTYDVWYWTGNSMGQRHEITNTGHIALTSLVTSLNLDSYTKISILTASAPNYTASENFITFTTTDKISGGNILLPRIVYMKNPALTGDLVISVNDTRPAAETDNPVVAVSWDKRDSYATLYYDRDMTKPAGVASASDIWLIWGGSAPIGTWIFGDSIDYVAEIFPDNQYMVIADGVTLEGVA